MAITDHYKITDLSEYIEDDKLILFQGIEYKDYAMQTLGVNVKYAEDDKDDFSNTQEIFDEVVKQGGFNIICHPHVYTDDYWSYNKLKEFNNYKGIEIFNNNVKHDNKGRAVATDLWDEVLSSGRVVYGFANDDMHVFSRAGGAFNMVLAAEKTRKAILESINKGSFYCSSGALIENVAVEENKIMITASKIPGEFRFIGKNGHTYYSHNGMNATYNCNGDEGYIRVELIREDGARAWTQPFFFHEKE